MDRKAEILGEDERGRAVISWSVEDDTTSPRKCTEEGRLEVLDRSSDITIC